MFNLEIAKFIFGTLVVGGSASFTAKQVIANNITPQTTSGAIQAAIGKFAIGAMVGHQATKFAEDTFDEAVDAVNQIKAKKAEQEQSS